MKKILSVKPQLERLLNVEFFKTSSIFQKTKEIEKEIARTL